MNKRFYTIAIMFLLVISFQSRLFSQCCSAGNPFFYGDQASLGKKQFLFLMGYKYSTSTKYFEGDSPIEIDFIDKAFFNFLTFQTQYGVTERLNVQADIGYFINKTECYKLDGWNNQRGYGIGDLMLTIRYLAYRNRTKKITITPSISVKFPIGVFDQEVDQVKLPITLQPSSGSFKYAANVYINKRFSNPRWNLGVFGTVEYAQLINSDNFYYKYGNMFMLSIIGSYRISANVNLGIEIREEYRFRSKREDNQVVESSGYNIFYSIPHISYTISKQWMINADIEIPIYKYYNGIQLGNTYAISARLSYNISLKKRIYDKM